LPHTRFGPLGIWSRKENKYKDARKENSKLLSPLLASCFYVQGGARK